MDGGAVPQESAQFNLSFWIKYNLKKKKKLWNKLCMFNSSFHRPTDWRAVPNSELRAIKRKVDENMVSFSPLWLWKRWSRKPLTLRRCEFGRDHWFTTLKIKNRLKRWSWTWRREVVKIIFLFSCMGYKCTLPVGQPHASAFPLVNNVHTLCQNYILGKLTVKY